MNEIEHTAPAASVPVGEAPEGLDAAGIMAPEHAEEIAFWIMGQKRMPARQEAQDER